MIKAQVVHFGDFQFDVAERRLYDKSREVALNPKAIDVLAYLIEHPHRIVPKEEILREVWGAVSVTDDALVQRVLDVRKVLHDSAKSPVFIRTHPKRGYEWIAEPDEEPSPLPSAEVRTPTATVSERRGSNLAWILLGAVCSIGGLLWLMGRSPGSEEAGRELRMVRLTALPGMEDYPAVERSGGRIVYASNEGGKSNLWLLHPSGNREALTSDRLNDSEPDWSPDGKWIAFRSERAQGGIYIISLADRVVTAVVGFGHHPRWSPDSSKLLFQTEGNDARIHIWDQESRHTTELRITAPDTANRAFPVWSETGKDVYFLAMAPATSPVPGGVTLGHQIWRVPASGGEAHLVTKGFGVVRDGGFDLRPDGRELVFIGLDRSLWKLAIAPGAKLGRQVRLTMTTEEHQHPRYTSTGEIAFSTLASPDSLWLVQFDSQGRPEEARMERLTRDGVLARQAAISPDGRRIAYITWGGERFEIWCVDVDTRRTWRVSPPSGPSRTRPLWSRDGRTLLYQMLEGAGRREIAGRLDETGETIASEMTVTPVGVTRNGAFDVEVDGRINRQENSVNDLTPDQTAHIRAAGGSLVQRSSDGRTIFFLQARDGWFNLWRLAGNNQGTGAEQVTHFHGNPYLLSDSNREFAVHSRGIVLSLRENRSDLWMIR